MFLIGAKIVLLAYLLVLLLLTLFGLHRYWILYLYWRFYKKAPPLAVPPEPEQWPFVTVQLPVYNEIYVIERLIESVTRLDYPKDRLEIQILDDSTDETSALAEQWVRQKSGDGYCIRHLRRPNRSGFKAGALAHGLQQARGEFLAIFDADFLPPPDFLKKVIPYFSDGKVGMVQARWGHLNSSYSLLTRLQSLFLDGHFVLEHTARNRSGAFFNFNGTAGIWRRETIDQAGGWMTDTLTEDLDLSYRAQLRGWRFLYLPHVVCPAELPVDMNAFRTQQYRWTKGALEVARKVLPDIWRSGFPSLVKLESTIHLTANLGYLLVSILSILLLPSLVARCYLQWPGVEYLEGIAFALTLISIGLFYYVAHREAHPSEPLEWRHLPALVALGIGMGFNNLRAALEAFLDIKTEFSRTAKLNIRNREESWRQKRYKGRTGSVGAIEMGLAVYFVFTFLYSLELSFWWSVPFILLFFFGYFYVGMMTLSHTLQKT
ncbi:MAG TPA: glycosyltransferase family 2 protein [Elusimicrobiota bacterium]|nr:glycosyltransferase family 2 protein [Elusimicrobiota bacterium]